MAEKRDIEQGSLRAKATDTARTVAQERLEDTIVGYGAVTGQNLQINSENFDWKYALMPAWMMTYKYKGELYYFAMNGQTGKIAGRVPVGNKKVNRLAWIIAGVGLAIGALFGGMMWL